MRAVLYTGKGGVGKTTTAAATAVQAARRGIKTLVMSTDPAHSLGDALAVPLSGMSSASSGADSEGGVVEVEDGLCALQVGSAQAGESWRTVQDYLLGVLETVGVDPVVAEELTSLPGAEEILALLELRRQVESGPWDLVVVDCAPTAETLRLLALPQALAWHVERLMPTQRGLWRTLRPAAVAASGLPLPAAEVMTALRQWRERLAELQAVLVSPQTSVRLVLTPERVVIAESRRTLTSLRLYGFAVDQVVVNRVFPQAGSRPDRAGSWLAGWNCAQEDGMREVAESFHPLPVVTTPYAAQEPTGVDALAALADSREGDVGDILAVPELPGMTVRSTRGGGYQLRLPLPLVTAAEVDLQRRDDELVVAVGEHRRIVALPSVLRRCLVHGAGVRDGFLVVSFVPDPQLWPELSGPGGPGA